MEAALRPYDLGSTHWYVFWHLANNGPTAQRGLLVILKVEKPTLAGVDATEQATVVRMFQAATQRLKDHLTEGKNVCVS
jgi:hypothetical protein